MHQSSHQTFLVSFEREYILATTKIVEIVAMIQAKAWTSPALLMSPPEGGGNDAIGGPGTVVMVGKALVLSYSQLKAEWETAWFPAQL